MLEPSFSKIEPTYDSHIPESGCNLEMPSKDRPKTHSRPVGSILDASLEPEAEEELEGCSVITNSVASDVKEQRGSSSQDSAQEVAEKVEDKKGVRVTFPNEPEEKIEEIDLKNETTTSAASNEGESVRREKSYYEKPRGIVLFKDSLESDEPEILYDVEFVYTEEEPALDVKLAGSWNGWMTTQMYKESSGKWSVITKMAKGKHEFRFVVDEVWLLSHVHPQTENEDPTKVNNIRVVTGPKRTSMEERTMIHVTKPSITCCVIQ